MKRTTTPEGKKAIFHQVGEHGREFDTLAAALDHVGTHKLTGYIVDPGDTVIDIRKGKRKGTKGWVPCGNVEAK